MGLGWISKPAPLESEGCGTHQPKTNPLTDSKWASRSDHGVGMIVLQGLL